MRSCLGHTQFLNEQDLKKPDRTTEGATTTFATTTFDTTTFATITFATTTFAVVEEVLWPTGSRDIRDTSGMNALEVAASTMGP